MAGRLEHGEVRLYKFSPPDKARPVLILTRGEALAYLSRATVAPITSTIRGVASEVRLDVEDGMKGPCAVNLHNVVTVAQKGLGRRVTKLSNEKMRLVCDAMIFAFGCEGLEDHEHRSERKVYARRSARERPHTLPMP